MDIRLVRGLILYCVHAEYHTNTLQQLPTTEEHVSDTTNATIPGEEQSYQRIGEGRDPFDFTWTIGVPTPGFPNDGQRILSRNVTNVTIPQAQPVCADPEDICGGSDDSSGIFFAFRQYRIHTRRAFLFFSPQCTEMCAGNLFVFIFHFLGWTCGACEDDEL